MTIRANGKYRGNFFVRIYLGNNGTSPGIYGFQIYVDEADLRQDIRDCMTRGVKEVEEIRDVEPSTKGVVKFLRQETRKATIGEISEDGLRERLRQLAT